MADDGGQGSQGLFSSRPNDEQETLLKDLNQCVEYRKTIEFFIKTKGLHGYFERNGETFKRRFLDMTKSWRLVVDPLGK